MPQLGFGGNQGFAPFPGHLVQANSNWNQNGNGPMRTGRGGRPYQANARTGPYDRQQPRNQRWGEPGRLSPPPGSRIGRGGMVGGGGRWGDGAAGGAAVGPREAVQGRSLKSYEDLDAVAGAGSGELNY